MIEPWFDPILYSWIPGTAMGVVGGLLGGLTGVLAPRGRARSMVLGLYGLMLSVSAVLLLSGLYALYCGQPYGIWYPLLGPGLLGGVIFGSLLPVVQKSYRQAEERRMMAQDL